MASDVGEHPCQHRLNRSLSSTSWVLGNMNCNIPKRIEIRKGSQDRASADEDTMTNTMTLPSPSPSAVCSPTSSRTLSSGELDGSRDGVQSSTTSSTTPCCSDETFGDVKGLCVTEESETHLKKKGRKGHSKSRRGCYNCKKARIKVNITLHIHLDGKH